MKKKRKTSEKRKLQLNVETNGRDEKQLRTVSYSVEDKLGRICR